jgi:hypothetical protein
MSINPNIGILSKLVRHEASIKPHVHKKIHEFLINMAFTMACPNFKKSLKMAVGPLGVKEFIKFEVSYHLFGILILQL